MHDSPSPARSSQRRVTTLPRGLTEKQDNVDRPLPGAPLPPISLTPPPGASMNGRSLRRGVQITPARASNNLPLRRATKGDIDVHSASLQRVLILLVPVLVLVSGCSSCQEAPELPAPVPQEGRLPHAPEPVTTPETPQIPPPACAVVGTASAEDGVAPLEVHFSAEGMCTDSAGQYTWDFGDGSEPVHEANPVHVFTKPGTYTVHVLLEDTENKVKDSDEFPISVTAPE